MGREMQAEISFEIDDFHPRNDGFVQTKPRQDLGNSGVQKRLQKDRYGLNALSA